MADRADGQRYNHKLHPMSTRPDPRHKETSVNQQDIPPEKNTPCLRKKSFAFCIIISVFYTVAALLVAPYLGPQPRHLDVDNLRNLEDGEKPQHGDQVAIPLHPHLHSSRDAMTLRFDWTITNGVRSPDGVDKLVYLVNDEFPGPTIEARSGDRIIVSVRNRVQDQGVSLHWHGLQMRGNNSMDGAVGVTQCPISSGQDFVYDFKIADSQHGTFWWHSHNKVQRGDGLYGGLIIHPPQQDSSYDHDDVLLMVGDWFHRQQADVLEWYASYVSLGNEPVPDSLQINGHGRFDCSMEMPAFPLNCTDKSVAQMTPIFRKKTAKTRVRFVNVGTVSGITAMVQGAMLQPIEVDGGCVVKSQPADSVGILYPGERTDALMFWKSDFKGEAWLNIYLDDENYARPNPALVAEQAFPALPETIKAEDFLTPRELAAVESHNNLAHLSAYAPVTGKLPPAQQKITLYLKTMQKSHLGHRSRGFVNHTSWEPQTRPLLSQSRSQWDENQLFLHIPTDLGPAHVDLVINNLDDSSHPIHLHGHSFLVLSSFRAQGRAGWGSYNPFDSSSAFRPVLDLATPLVKDTVSVPRRGHVILRVLADNPGLWLLHCHMMVHMGTGMAAGLHVGPAQDEQHVSAVDTFAAALCEG